ncbi:hypothetical protein NEE66_10140 [Thauera linaloolentis]|nr:hypothetical protein [Thauera linaloolentis]MCM8565947.1 hypothetical protein [Thauera linaloolentis]
MEARTQDLEQPLRAAHAQRARAAVSRIAAAVDMDLSPQQHQQAFVRGKTQIHRTAGIEGQPCAVFQRPLPPFAGGAAEVRRQRGQQVALPAELPTQSQHATAQHQRLEGAPAALAAAAQLLGLNQRIAGQRGAARRQQTEVLFRPLELPPRLLVHGIGSTPSLAGGVQRGIGSAGLELHQPADGGIQHGWRQLPGGSHGRAGRGAHSAGPPCSDAGAAGSSSSCVSFNRIW